MADKPLVSDVIHRVYAVEDRWVFSDEAVVAASRHGVWNPGKMAFKRAGDERRHACRFVLPGPQILTGAPWPARKQGAVDDVLLAIAQWFCSENKFDKSAPTISGVIAAIARLMVGWETP
jgi:hypothetical protein